MSEAAVRPFICRAGIEVSDWRLNDLAIFHMLVLDIEMDFNFLSQVLWIQFFYFILNDFGNFVKEGL